jgi:molecular chaperone GrpE (heat shock protein)
VVVRQVRQEYDALLNALRFREVRPEIGGEVNPKFVETKGMAEVEGVAPGMISRVDAPGFTLDGFSIQPAFVQVAPQPAGPLFQATPRGN